MTRISRWYARLPERRQERLRRYVPPAVLAVVVAAVWCLIRWNGRGLTSDRNLLKAVGVASVYGAVVALLGARRWSLVSLGLLAYMLAVAGMLLRLFVRMGPQPVEEWERDLMRAFFLVGALCLNVGLTLWMIATRFGTREARPKAWDGTTERRNGKERRRDWPPPSGTTPA